MNTTTNQAVTTGQYALAAASGLSTSDERIIDAASRPFAVLADDDVVFIVCSSHRQRGKIQFAMRSLTGREALSYYTMRRGGVLLAVPSTLANVLRHGPGVSRWRRQAGEGEPRLCVGQYYA